MPIRPILAAALLLAGPAARACSVARGYKVPTTLELATRADAVVLARVADAGPSKHAGIAKARLVPVTLLKGAALPRAIRFDDAHLSSARIKATRSDPRDLTEANPDAFNGGCNRYMFDEGMLLVVFLRRDGEAFVPTAPAFSRALEDVPSAAAPWVKAVKLHIRVAALPAPRRRAALRAERARLARDRRDPDAPLLVQDIDRSLR